MHKTLYGKVMSSTMSKHAPELYNKVLKNQDPVANFCIEKCPHTNKPCEGDCYELREYRKTHTKQHNIVC